MIEIKKKSELKGAEKYGDCNSCSKRSNETDLYQIDFIMRIQRRTTL